MKAVEIKDFSFKYTQKDDTILKDINVSLNEKEIIGLVGKSGSGKSTLCYCICGIIPHIYKGKMKGSISVYQQNIRKMSLSEIASTVGIVFQNPDTQLFSPSVEDELAFGPENLCINRDEIDKRITKALKMVHMTQYRFANPNELSGGEKQLIAIASVLTLQPSVLVCDEIMSQIDASGKERIKHILLSLKKQGNTILMIDHDLNNLSISDRILMIENGKISNYAGKLK